MAANNNNKNVSLEESIIDIDSNEQFEEERKALLNGMAAKLNSVIQRMAEVNKNLDKLSKDSESVSSLNKIWQQSYLETDNNQELSDSSLLVYKKS